LGFASRWYAGIEERIAGNGAADKAGTILIPALRLERGWNLKRNENYLYMHMHMHMHIDVNMVKVISVSDETYALLKRIKGQKMSFSEAIKEAIYKNKQDRGEIMVLFGVLKGKINAKRWKARLYEERERPWNG
jgi:predicted CopG family antitoxin